MYPARYCRCPATLYSPLPSSLAACSWRDDACLTLLSCPGGYVCAGPGLSVCMASACAQSVPVASRTGRAVCGGQMRVQCSIAMRAASSSECGMHHGHDVDSGEDEGRSWACGLDQGQTTMDAAEQRGWWCEMRTVMDPRLDILWPGLCRWLAYVPFTSRITLKQPSSTTMNPICPAERDFGGECGLVLAAAIRGL